MLLHDSILWAIGPDGASGLRIFCDDSMKREIADFFEEIFTEEWHSLLDEVEEVYGDCYEKDEEVEPIFVNLDEEGVSILFDPLSIFYGDGEFIADLSGDDALKKTLKKLKKKYPGIKYEGYVGYRWSDAHSGETVQYEISSEKLSKKNDKVYEFVGEAMANMLEEDDDYFWEEMEGALFDGDKKDFKQVIRNFVAYEKWIGDELFDRLLEIAEEVDDEMIESLEAYIEKCQEDFSKVEEKEIEEETGNDLPKGYMEVLSLVSYAEEEGFKTPIRQVTGIEGHVAFVEALAKNGDEEAEKILAEYKKVNE